MTDISGKVAESLPSETADFYRRAMLVLREADIPFLVGGAYAYACYTGVVRHTKDFDVFLRQSDVQRALDVLREAGYETDLTFPHWLGKAHHGKESIDLIYGSGNGLAHVDDAWFDRTVQATILDVEVDLCPAEEIIWTKAFIMERERFDGADIAHILLKRGQQIDWERMIALFGPYWHILLVHLVLFRFIYPAERDLVPEAVWTRLLRRLERSGHVAPPRNLLCQGTLLSRAQYLIDIDEWGYTDARLEPMGEMTREEIRAWTEAIDKE